MERKQGSIGSCDGHGRTCRLERSGHSDGNSVWTFDCPSRGGPRDDRLLDRDLHDPAVWLQHWRGHDDPDGLLAIAHSWFGDSHPHTRARNSAPLARLGCRGMRRQLRLSARNRRRIGRGGRRRCLGRGFGDDPNINRRVDLAPYGVAASNAIQSTCRGIRDRERDGSFCHEPACVPIWSRCGCLGDFGGDAHVISTACRTGCRNQTNRGETGSLLERGLSRRDPTYLINGHGPEAASASAPIRL